MSVVHVKWILSMAALYRTELNSTDKSTNAGNQSLRKHLISSSADMTRYPFRSHV